MPLYHQSPSLIAYHQNPSSADASLSNAGYVEFGSRKSTMDEIKAKLEDSTVRMIGVHGPGGVGKSTSVKEIAKKARDNKLFNVVVIVNITKDPNLQKIQEEIAYDLGLTFEGEGENGRADRLRRRLKQEKENTLVILDDLWDGLDLKKLGIPFDDDDSSRMTVKDKKDFGYKMEEKEKSTGGYDVNKLSPPSKSKSGTPFDNNDYSRQVSVEEEKDFETKIDKGEKDFSYKMLKNEISLGEYKGCKILLTSRIKEVLSEKMNSTLTHMAHQTHPTIDSQRQPKLLLHGPPGFSSDLPPYYSDKFHILNRSSLPLHLFIASHTHLASSITAMLCDGGYAVNADHIDLHECRSRGVQVACDMALALFIDVIRKISAADRCLRRRALNVSWDFPLGSKLGGKKVGIIGLGKIGLEVAHRLEAFRCIILYNSRNQKPFVSYPFYSSVVELATNSDALIICCALNEQTRHIIDKEVMLALGKGGVIVNIGRGALVDEKELLRCLMEEELGGAGLDVFENEPHVPEEFVSLNNVVLSPHVAFSTSESYMGICELVGRNLEAFFSNKPLITPVMVD